MKQRNPLEEYKEKRDFKTTPEPSGTLGSDSDEQIYVIQKHDARNLHYDLRLELEGVLKSWAVPKGPSMDPGVKRLAIPTEDHPILYANFEGVIPEGNYGAGIVIVWDSGVYNNTKGKNSSIKDDLNEGHVTIFLKGTKLIGKFALIKTRRSEKNPQWLFFKMKDEFAKPGTDIISEMPNSSQTGRSLIDVAKQESPADLHIE